MRHVLSVADIGRDGLHAVLDRAADWKRGNGPQPATPEPVVAFVLERTAFRTRLAYEAALHRLNGRLVPFEGQLESREALADVARVLSEMTNLVLARVRDHAKLEALAELATVPVINALSSREHPVEVLADALTMREAFGELQGRKLAFIGDGGNVCQSVLLMAPLLGMHCAVATPATHAPDADILGQARQLAAEAGCQFDVLEDAALAVQDADAVYTDGWPPFDSPEEREWVFGSYRVDASLFDRAKPDAVFLHCLPAHRGQEVTDEVLDGPQSMAFRRLSNLAPTSGALIEWLLKPVQ